jgi:hypothetical protein
MGSRQRRQRVLRDRSGAASFFAELGRGLLAIPSLTIGLLLIAVFFQTAAEMAEGVWQAVVAFGVAIAVSVGALMLVGWVATVVIGPAAVGWLAIFAGQHPAEYGPSQRNGARALANLLLFASCGPLGVILFRHGAREGELNWAIEGLFLTAAAVVLGLGSAIPRLYFAARAKRSGVEPVESEGVIAFVITAMLGIGLSLGISMGFSEARSDSRERTMRPAIWHTACVRSEKLKSCVPQIAMTLVAAKQGVHRVDLRASCAVTLGFKPGDGRPLSELSWMELRRLKIVVYDKEREIRTRALQLAAGQRVLVEVTPRGGEGCVFKLRYHLPEEPAR